MTTDIREHVAAIWRKHRVTFELLAEALSAATDADDGVVSIVRNPTGETRGDLVLFGTDGTELVRAASVPDLYERSVLYADKNGLLANLPVPYPANPKKCYLVNTTPFHRDGTPFGAARTREVVTSSRGTLYIYALDSSAAGLRKAVRLLRSAGVALAD